MESPAQISYNYIDKYLTKVRAQGRYAFTLDELKDEFKLPYPTLKQNLYRLKIKNEVAQIRQGFYVIIPPEYSKQGMLPPYLFVDDLMKSLDKPYYVGLLSAAALHGAAHQQPMEFFVIVQTPAPRSINNGKLKVTFLSKNTWEQENIIQKKSNAGYISVSSPELTAFDLLAYAKRIGLNMVASIIQELTQSIKVQALSKLAKRYPATPIIQRLGYLLDRVLGEEILAGSLKKIITERNTVLISLSTMHKKEGGIDSKWKVVKNIDIETDL